MEGAPVPLTFDNIRLLTDAAAKIRNALGSQGITGADGAEIDHIEIFGPAESPAANSRNFVYCPGGAYDRSPCGTGTSAKLACLAAIDKLRPGEMWVQESIIGSRFTATYREDRDGHVIPRITGAPMCAAKHRSLNNRATPFVTGSSPRGSHEVHAEDGTGDRRRRAGIIGIACADYLKKAGLQVTVIDQGTDCRCLFACQLWLHLSQPRTAADRTECNLLPQSGRCSLPSLPFASSRV